MVNVKYILSVGIIFLMLCLLGQNYRSLRVIDQQEDLLRWHLGRLQLKNANNEVLTRNGVRVINSHSYLVEKYLDAENNLKSEYTYIPADTNDLIISLEQEHKSEEKLDECLMDLFTHTDLVLTHIKLIKKSITDDFVHLGVYRNLHKTGKYEVKINNVMYPFSSDHAYTVECADTLNLEIKMDTINWKTNKIDTTLFKEQLLVNKL